MEIICIFRNLKLVHKIVYRRWNHFIFHQAGIRTPDRKIARGMLIDKDIDDKERFLRCLAHLPTGVSEVIFHPGCIDPEVDDSPEYINNRLEDASIVCDQDIIEAIKAYGIELISYKKA